MESFSKKYRHFKNQNSSKIPSFTICIFIFLAFW